MTVNTRFYTMDNKLGVDLNYIQSSVTITSDPAVPGPRGKVGDRVQGADGSEWMFVKASATVTAFNVVAIDSDGNCGNITSALVTSNRYVYGIAHFRPAPSPGAAEVSSGNASGGVANTGDYFWALMKANFGAQANFLTTGLAGAKVYISSSVSGGGVLTTSASTNQLTGIAAIETMATTTVVTTLEVAMYGYIVPYVSV